MKVYVAAPYPAREYVEGLFPVLAEAGHECTSTWALGSREIHVGTVGASLDTEHDDVVRHVTGDLYDVARSQALVSLTANFLSGVRAFPPNTKEEWLHTGGRHVELGYALHAAMRIHVIVVGEPENVFQRGLATLVPDIPAAIRALG